MAQRLVTRRAAAPTEPLRLTLEERAEVSETVASRPAATAESPMRTAPSPAAAPREAPLASETIIEEEQRMEAEERRERATERLERDMRELMEAKRALAGAPRQALELARRGEREFPGSVLGEERRHVLILALIGAGKHEEARRLATPYLERYPDSPFAVRVRAALGSR
jgi:hypothetical protein